MRPMWPLEQLPGNFERRICEGRANGGADKSDLRDGGLWARQGARGG